VTRPIEIGEDSNVQTTVVHVEDMPSIGRRVTIGHRAVIHGCTIEDECPPARPRSPRRRASAVGHWWARARRYEGQVVPPEVCRRRPRA
jgi:hypothetical protein